MQTQDTWAAKQGFRSLPGPVWCSRVGGKRRRRRRRRRSRGDKHARRDHIPLEQQLSLPPPLWCPRREPRGKVSPALGWLPGGMPGLPGIAKLLLPLRHPALSFIPRASTELQHLPRSCQAPCTTVTEREKKEKDVIAAINH